MSGIAPDASAPAVGTRRRRGPRSVHRAPVLSGWGVVFLLLGLGMLGNALWMLAGPMHWYAELPAAVPDTGPFNAHFVRDVGCAFLATGLALGWAAFAPAFRLPLVGVATVFLVAHAGLHGFDTLRGALPADHWWRDLPGVYAPALLLAIATRRLLQVHRAAHSLDDLDEAPAWRRSG